MAKQHDGTKIGRRPVFGSGELAEATRNRRLRSLWHDSLPDTKQSRRFPLLILLTVAFFSFGTIAQATEPYTPKVVNPLTESWRWKHFPEMEGKGVRHIAEGDDRRVWMSFNDGIYEYNGYEWKLHNAENGLTATPVDQVLAAADGLIYAATPRGIFRYNGMRWTRLFAAPDNLDFVFHQLRELTDGSLMACSNRGVLHFSEKARPDFYTSAAKAEALAQRIKTVNWIRLPEKLVTDGDFTEISDVLEDRGGVIWFAVTLPNELGRLLKFRLPGPSISSLADYQIIVSDDQSRLGEGQKFIEAQDGKIWVINSNFKSSITVFDGAKRRYIKLSDQFGGDEYMTDILQSADGTIWIGSLGKLYAFRNNVWELYSMPNFAIPANRLMLQQSRGNKLWVAGYKSKVFLIDCSTDRWITYADLNFQCETASGEQWFLEVSGKVVRRKGNTWTAFDTRDGLMDSPIRLLVTSRGQLWAAGSHQGVAATAVLKTGGWERHRHPSLSWGIDYRAVFEAADGALWFGSAVDPELDKGQRSGLLQLPDPTADPLTWIHHQANNNGLNQTNAYGIGQSKDGRIWVGGSSLRFFDGKTWQLPDDGRLRQVVNVICSTSDWLIVGSRYYGVFIFDGEKWRNFDTASGLSSNTVISIDAVSDSCIFVATENGICRYDGTSWVQQVLPPELNMDFEGGAILHDSAGEIWVNTSSRNWKRRAFTHSKTQEGNERHNFTTHRYLPDDMPPETLVTLFTKEVSQEGNTLIQWEGKDFFAQSAAERLTFSYRLDGGKWSAFSPDRHHTFTSLTSGAHSLEVRARDLDLNIDPTPAVVVFDVLPPVWKQTWFILLMLAVLTTFGIYEYRVISKKQKLEKVNRSLQLANEKLKERGKKIESQNQEILAQQEQILAQSKALELNNLDLEERNAEIELQRDKLERMVEQVEELSRAKLSFFTNISHELRTPLTLILGPAEQLQHADPPLPETERRRLYGIIERNASRLLKLINQLLEMRRIEQSSLELNLHDVNLPDYIAGMVNLFENLAVERDIYLDFDNHCDQAAAALDPDKVEKIVVNLLSNAFKHTPDGGSIVARLDLVSGTDHHLPPMHDRYFQLIVEDTGAGISQEDLAHIFERYFTSAIDKADPMSSGIGLAYIQDLLALMQGAIRVESTLGKGTTFLVYLPFAPAQCRPPAKSPAGEPSLLLARQEVHTLLSTYAAQPAPVNKSRSEPQLKRVLLVEDNPDMLSFLEGVLRNKYHILTAENGKEGLTIARNHSLDLIISDVMMPEMDGLVFCEQLKSDLVTSHIPLILLTAKVLDENKMSGFQRGADDYITKPFNPSLLIVRMENLLKQREQLREAYNRDFLLTPKEVRLSSPDEELLKKLVDIMEENLGETGFNVNKMCEMVHLSHMHFIRKVKQLTGKKPIDLLKSFRMKRAKDLLAQNKLTIAEIAYTVGYDLPNSFSRAFKKEFGVSPTEHLEALEEI